MRQVMRKGLITVAAATGVLAMTGGYAHADASAAGAALGSPGVVSGNVVQAPVEIPVNVCGNSVSVLSTGGPVVGSGCGTRGEGRPPSGGPSAGGQSGGSSGVVSGNQVQVPVDVPVNVCGNSVRVLSRGVPVASGCGARDESRPPSGGSSSGGRSEGSSGVASGNQVQTPVEIPVNVCGNAVSVAAFGNAAVGDDCVDSAGGPGQQPPSGHPMQPPGTPEEPGTPEQSSKPHDMEPAGDRQAAADGADQLAETGSALPVGTTLMVGAGALIAGAVLYRKARTV